MSESAGRRDQHHAGWDTPVALLRVGGFDVIALTDAVGRFPLPVADAFSGATTADWREARRMDPAAFAEGGVWTLSFRSYAVRRPDGHLTLVDLGVGGTGSLAASWAPTPGALLAQLEVAGLDPADVGTVVLTHIHADHVGWAVGSSNHPNFPNAQHVVQQLELDHLLATGRTDMVRRVIEPLAEHGLLRPLEGAAQLYRNPGGDHVVDVTPTPGHTPGHQSVTLSTTSGTVLLTGDAFVHVVQLANPEVGYVYEDLPAQAVATRRRLLDQARTPGTTLANPHFMSAYLTGADLPNAVPAESPAFD